MVATGFFSISNINFTGARIDRDTRWSIERSVAGIQSYAFDGSIRRISNALGPNLEQESAPVVRIFLDDAILAAGKPHVILVIDEATVESFREGFSIPPGVNDIPLGIKLNHRGCLTPGVQFILGQISPVNDEHMILSVRTHPAHRTSYPLIRQGLGPRRIHFVTGWAALGVQRQWIKHREHDGQRRASPSHCERGCLPLHTHVITPLSIRYSRLQDDHRPSSQTRRSATWSSLGSAAR